MLTLFPPGAMLKLTEPTVAPPLTNPRPGSGPVALAAPVAVRKAIWLLNTATPLATDAVTVNATEVAAGKPAAEATSV